MLGKCGPPYLGENGYRCMYGWVTLLYTWNYHNIVNQSYSSINIKLLLLFLNVALPKETLVPCKESTVWQNFLDPSSNCLLFAVSIFPALSSLTVWFLYTYVLLWTAAFSISPFQPLASPSSTWCPPNTLPLTLGPQTQTWLLIIYFQYWPCVPSGFISVLVCSAKDLSLCF